ncbi:hypothetical protein LX36DRAFT_545703, partial [Colletotrichum falcatum]
ELRQLSFKSVARENHGKNKREILDELIDKVTLLVRATTREGLPKDEDFCDTLIACCQDVPECGMALLNPPETFNDLCAQLRSNMRTSMLYEGQKTHFFTTSQTNTDDQYWVDRKYNGQNSRRPPQRGRGRSYRDYPQRKVNSTAKKCFVCRKIGCWSTKHTKEEQSASYARYKDTLMVDTPPEEYQQFLLEYEGSEIFFTEENCRRDDENHLTDDETFFTSTAFFGKESINGQEAYIQLRNQATLHALTKEDTNKDPTIKNNATDEVFTFDDRYSADVFQGIMPDTGAARVSTAGQQQYAALCRHIGAKLPIDTGRAGEATIRFGSGDCFESLGTVKVPTPIGSLTFHVMASNTPFLLCLKDMDQHGVRFDNLANVLVKGETVVPIIRKWGHAWMLLEQPERTVAQHHLTDGELRQIHRRFGHPSVHRLHKVLQRAGHETDISTIEEINKFCRSCQLNSRAPGRFKFTLRDDYDFNYEVFVDVMYLDGNKPVLHVVDGATAFNAAKFLRSISAEHTWEALR